MSTDNDVSDSSDESETFAETDVSVSKKDTTVEFDESEAPDERFLSSNEDEETPPNDQAELVAKIDEIRVDPDTVVKHFTKNLRNKDTLYDPRSFEVVGIRSDDPCTIKVGVDPRDDGAYYPDSPHPVWLSPSTFVRGWSHDEHDVQSDSKDIGLPREAENKRILREDGYDEGTEAFEEAHETGMKEWRELWDHEVRKDLKDEIRFRFGHRVPEMETFEHTVSVRYVE